MMNAANRKKKSEKKKLSAKKRWVESMKIVVLYRHIFKIDESQSCDTKGVVI